jgi:phage N-6-adenine-methyltransferase
MNMQLPLFENGSPKKSRKPSGRMAVHYASTGNQWQTPEHIVDRAIDVLGAIDLDPCSNSKNAPESAAKIRYALEEDGLSRVWHGRVWMNPPYGRAIGKWVEKLCSEYETGDVTAAVALLPARTDTQWWQRIAGYPICMIRGRLRFGEYRSSAPFPSAVMYLGPLLSRFAGAFSSIGTVYTPFGVSDLPPSPTWPR